MQFHERLKNYRKEKGLTQEGLAEKLHVSRSAVAKWENGLGLPSGELLDKMATFFGITPNELLADRETETIIVGKNSKLSQQRKWLIGLVCLVIALLVVGSVLIGIFITYNNEIGKDGGGEVEILGIGASFNAQYEKLDGNEKLKIYHLKTGETYEFYVHLYHRGSQDVRLSKSGVNIYYDTQLFTFDAGEYWEEPDRDGTPTDEYPFYFTCLNIETYTEILVTADSYWYKVAVVIEN